MFKIREKTFTANTMKKKKNYISIFLTFCIMLTLIPTSFTTSVKATEEMKRKEENQRERMEAEAAERQAYDTAEASEQETHFISLNDSVVTVRKPLRGQAYVAAYDENNKMLEFHLMDDNGDTVSQRLEHIEDAKTIRVFYLDPETWTPTDKSDIITVPEDVPVAVVNPEAFRYLVGYIQYKGADTNNPYRYRETLLRSSREFSYLPEENIVRITYQVTLLNAPTNIFTLDIPAAGGKFYTGTMTLDNVTNTFVINPVTYTAATAPTLTSNNGSATETLLRSTAYLALTLEATNLIMQQGGYSIRDLGFTNYGSNIPVVSLAIYPTRLNLAVGDVSDPLTVTVIPPAAANRRITWTSSDEAIATVTPDGVVTGVSAGDAEITATVGGKAISCPVTVVNSLPSLVRFEANREYAPFTITDYFLTGDLYQEQNISSFVINSITNTSIGKYKVNYSISGTSSRSVYFFYITFYDLNNTELGKQLISNNIMPNRSFSDSNYFYIDKNIVDNAAGIIFLSDSGVPATYPTAAK